MSPNTDRTDKTASVQPENAREIHHAACNVFFGYDQGRCNGEHGKAIAGLSVQETERLMKL